MRLYIIRHGETSWNKAKRLQGRKDIMLDADGIRLAEKTGEGMQDIDFDLDFKSFDPCKADGRTGSGRQTDSNDHGQAHH